MSFREFERIIRIKSKKMTDRIEREHDSELVRLALGTSALMNHIGQAAWGKKYDPVSPAKLYGVWSGKSKNTLSLEERLAAANKRSQDRLKREAKRRQ